MGFIRGLLQQLTASAEVARQVLQRCVDRARRRGFVEVVGADEVAREKPLGLVTFARGRLTDR